MTINLMLVACYGYLQPPNAEPFSIEILHSHLLSVFGKSVTCDLEILDYREDPDGSKLIEKIIYSKSKIDILGVSIPQSTYNLSVNFLNKYNGIFPGSMIVLGHSLPTHNPESFFSIFPNVLIVRGWGEESFIQLVDLYTKHIHNYSTIDNLMFFDKQIIKNQLRWPSKYVKPTRINLKDFFTRVESSRGCHYDKCTFCTRPPRENNKPSWFRYPVDQVLDEISQLKKNGVKAFTFTDEDFFGNDLIGAEKIIDGITKIGGIRYSFSVRVDNVINIYENTENRNRRIRLLNKLKESGVSLIFLGVESLSDNQLLRYGKGYRVNEALQAVSMLKSLGIKLELGYILFDPLLTFSELGENVVNLNRTKLWGEVDCLFDKLRVQKNTMFEYLLKGKKLIKQLDNESMSYEYFFENKEIQLLSDYCQQWKSEIHLVFMLARNIQRTKLLKTACDEFVYDIRRLEFSILQKFLKANNKSEFEGILKTFRQRRTHLVKHLSNQIFFNNGPLTLSEQTLQNAIESYLHSWVNE